MRKTLLALTFVAIAATTSMAQSFKRTFTAEDTTAIPTWWVGNSENSYWDYYACDQVIGYYPVFTYELNDTLKGWTWATDLKVDLTPDDWDAVKFDLYLSFWINALDGVNAEDSLAVVMEIDGPDLDGGKAGWPNAKFKIGSANTWTWVSLSISQLQFSGQTPDAFSNINLFKFSVQPVKDYAPEDNKVFQYAIQDIVLSSGETTATAEPCKNVGISPVSKKNEMFYPNPAKGFINLKKIASGEIVDLSGKVVLKFSNSDHVDISSLSAGMYLIRIDNHIEKLMVK